MKWKEWSFSAFLFDWETTHAKYWTDRRNKEHGIGNNLISVTIVDFCSLLFDYWVLSLICKVGQAEMWDQNHQYISQRERSLLPIDRLLSTPVSVQPVGRSDGLWRIKKDDDIVQVHQCRLTLYQWQYKYNVHRTLEISAWAFQTEWRS